MSECKRINEKILEYLEGMLPQKQKEELEKHIAACPQCKKQLESVLATSKVIQAHLVHKAEKIEVPTLLWGKILTSVRKNKRERVARTWIKVAVGVTAAVALLLTGTFAPVFGAEGNLINLITSNIISSQANSFTDMYTDDFTGQFRKAAAEAEITKATGITQQEIWDLKQQGFRPYEIPIVAFIVKNGTMQFDEVTALRSQKGWGWGRVANNAGISVFSASSQVAAPIAMVKENVQKTDEIEIDSDLATTDHQVVLSGIKTPIPVTQETTLEDQFGKPVTLNEVAELGCARIKLRLVGGKPIALAMIAQCPPQKVAAVGQASMLANGGIIIETPQGEAIVIPGDTNIIGQLVQGTKVFVQGLRARGRFIARLVRVLPVTQTSPPKANEGGQGNEGQATPPKNDEGKSVAGSQKPAPDGKTPHQKDEQGHPTQEKQPDRILLEAFDATSNIMTTNIGKFVVSERTIVTVNTSLGNIGLSTEAVGRFPVGTEIKFVSKENEATEIVFLKSAITETQGVLLGRGAERGKITLLTKGLEKVEFFFVLGTRIENNDLPVPGSICFMVSVGQNALYMRLREPKLPLQGKVIEMTDDSITIQDPKEQLTLKLTPHTVFAMQNQPPKGGQGPGPGGRQGQGNPGEGQPLLVDIEKGSIKPGDVVRVFWVQFESQRIALEVIKLGPKPNDKRPDATMFHQVASIVDVEGTDQKEIKLRGDMVIIVSQSKTTVFLPVRAGAFKKGSISDIRQGSKIRLVLYEGSMIAKEVTVNP